MPRMGTLLSLCVFCRLGNAIAASISKSRSFALASALTVCAGLIVSGEPVHGQAPPVPRSVSSTAIAPTAKERLSLIGVPLRFQRNRGQVAGAGSDGAQFVGLGPGYRVWLAPDSVNVELPGRPAVTGQAAQGSSVLGLKLEGGAQTATLGVQDRLQPVDSYFKGTDAKQWLTGVENWGRVIYGGVYPGIDAVFYGKAGKLEYDLLLQPRADARKVRFTLSGMEAASVDAEGNLQLRMAAGEVRLLKPIAYQMSRDGKSKEPVEVEYTLAQGKDVAFKIGKYDHTRPLVIDPVLDYATYLSSTYQFAMAVAADANGNSYVALEPPSTQGFSVLEFDPNGNLLTASTISSNSGGEIVPAALATGPGGSLYVVGSAQPGLPTTGNAFQRTNNNGSNPPYASFNAFLAVLKPSNSNFNLSYASYLGGVGNGSYSSDWGFSVAVDAQGNAYVAGNAEGGGFPTTAGAYQTTYLSNSTEANFVAKFNPSQSGTASLVYSTMIGGAGVNAGAYLGASVAVDAAGNAYLSSYEPASIPFPITSGAFSYSGPYAGNAGDLYITKFNASGTALVYSAFLGPISNASFLSLPIAVDGSGDAYVSAIAAAEDFPTTSGAYQTSYPGAFVSELNSAGSALVYSTFLGGPSSAFSSGNVIPYTLSIPAGCSSACPVYVVGQTTATDFPAINAIQSSLGASPSGFAVELNGAGSGAVYSTYLGGIQSPEYNPGYSYYPSSASPNGALDGAGDLYIAGNNSSTGDFPVTPTPGQASPGGAYLAKIGPANVANVVAVPSTLNCSAPQPVGVSSAVYPGAPQTFVLRNMGSQTVILQPFELLPAVEWAETDNCNGAIAAGGYCTVNVNFIPDTAGPASGTLTVSSASGVLATVSLNGSAQDSAFISIAPSSLYFGDQTVGSTSAAQTFTITNVGNAPGSPQFGGGASGFVVQNNCPSTLQPAQSCVATVQFAPIIAGYAFGSVSVYNAVSGYAVANFSGQGVISGTGGTGSLIVSPTTLNLGEQLVGAQSAGQSFTVTNTGSVPVTLTSTSLTLTSAQGQAADFSATANVYSACGSLPYQLLPQQSCSYATYFTPSAAATETATLSIADTTSSSPHTLTLSGIGIVDTQTVEFAPGNLSFADQPIGVPSGVQSIFVTASGTAPVNIDRVLVSGDFQLSYQNCSGTTLPGSIIPGYLNYGYCQVQVTFTPTATGPRTGTLILVDSASGNPQVLNLVGNGIVSVAGPPTADPTALTFPAQIVATTSNAQSVTLTNPGNSPITINTVATTGNFAVNYNGCPTSSQLTAGESCALQVVFTPTSSTSNPLTGTMTIGTTAGNQVVNLSGSGVAASQALGFTPSSVNFGSIVDGTTSYTYPMYIRSVGSQAVTFNSSPTISGPFTVVADYCTPYSPLAAGTSCEMDLAYTPTTSSGTTQSGSLVFSTSAGTKTLSLSGTGVANTPVLVAVPSALAFTQQPLDTPSSQYGITFTSNSSSTVNITSVKVTSGSSNFVIQSGFDGCTGQQLTQSGQCTVYLTFAPSVAGYDTGVVTFATSAGNVTAALSGYSPAASDTSYLSPGNLVFNPQVVAIPSAVQQLYLNNTSNGTITVGTLTGTDFGSTSEFTTSPDNGGVDNCSGVQIGSGGTCMINVAFTPSNTGSRTGNVTFPITYGDGTTGSQTATLSGTGVAQNNDAVITPSTLFSFTDQVVGTVSNYQTVYLTNSGNVALTVGAVSGVNYGSGKPFSLYQNNAGYDGCSGATVQPASQCVVYVTFTPASAGAQTGTLVFPVTYYHAAGATNLTATLSGNGVAASNQVVLSPTALNFGNETVATSSNYQTVTLTNYSNQAVTVGKLSGTNYGSGKPFWLYQNNAGYDGCSSTSVPANSSCVVYVVFTPSSATSYSGTIVFPVTYTGGGTPVNFTATLSGTGLAASQSMVLTQTSVAFGSQAVGTTSQQVQVLLTNQSPNYVTVNSILLGGTNPGDFQESDNCAGSTVYPNSYCTISITFAPSLTSTGSRSAKITETDSATTGSRTITLTGTGTNQSPALVFYPSSLTFSSSQTVGEGSAPQNVTVTNTGVNNLNISKVVSSDPAEFQVIEDGCTGQSLGQGQSCTIAVVFSPNSASALSATINVTDNAPGSPHKLTVSGGGATQLSTTTTLTATPSTAAFGGLVTLTAAVKDQNSHALTNGTVTFYSGTSLLGSAQVVRTASAGGTIGTAVLTTLALPPGTDSVTAKYVGGDGTSTSAPVSVTITGTYPSVTTFASSGSAGNYTFTGTVQGMGPLTPTGNVTFNDTTTGLLLGTAAIDANSVTQALVNAPSSPSIANPAEFVATADLNGDGKADLIIGTGTSSQGFIVQLGNGDGTFQNPKAFLNGTVVSGMAFADFNGDGKLDIAFYAGGAVGVMLGNGDGTFQDEAYYDNGLVQAGSNGQNVVVGDFNGDGIPDIAIANADGAIDLLLGSGDGTFQEPEPISLGSGNTPFWLASADLNGDGHPDLVAGCYGGSGGFISVLLGNGNGTFQTPKTFAISNEPTFVTLADLRGTGKLDVIAAEGSSVGVLLGNGDGTFGSETTVLSGSNYGGASVADVTGDGKLDLLVADQNNNVVDILPGAGTGTFGAAMTYATGSQPASVAAPDLNNDGRPDVLVANQSSNSVTMLVNTVTQMATLTSAIVPGTSATSHSVTANYVGDTNFAAGVSNALQLTPTPITPTVTLAGVPGTTVAWGKALSVKVTMSGPLAFVPTPSGNVSYTIDGGTAKTANLASGTVTIPISQLSVGSHTFAATYNGDQFYVTGNKSLGLTIIKANQTITFGALGTVTYGVSPITLSATASSGLAVTFKVVSGPGTISNGVLTVTGAGSVVVEADQAGNVDYNAAPAVQQTLTVNTAPLTITVNNASRTYGASNPTFTGTVSGLVNGDTVTVTYSTTATSASAVGTYSITAAVSGTKAANYTPTITPGTLTVTTAPLTITVNNASRNYGAANPTFTGTVSGLLNGDTVTVTYSTTATSASNVGTYSITAAISGTKASNYTPTVTPGTLTVNTAPLTVTVNNASRTYGASNPTFTGTVGGLQNGDTVTVTYSTTATTASGVGTYSITAAVSGAKTANYTTTITPGTLTVNAAPLTVTVNNASRTYGAANPAFSGTVSGLQNGDTVTVAYSTAATTTSGVGTYSITAAVSGAASSNYTTTVTPGTLTITKAPLTITVNNASRPYGAANPAFTGTVSGLLNGDTVTVTYSTPATAASGVGSYSITAAISGSAAPNYAPTVTPGTLTVTKAPLKVIANNLSMSYGSAVPTLSYTITGFLNGDTQATATTGAPALSTTGTSTSAPGSYPITVTVGTLASSNYSLGLFKGTLTITKAKPVITWNAPAPITYPTALSSTQLDATSTVAGTFAYSPIAGTVLSPGTHALSVTLTPTNTTDYTTATLQVNLTVNAPPTFYVAPAQNVGSASIAQKVGIQFSSSFTLGSISVVSQGVANLDFKFATGGTCSVGTAYAAGQACTVMYKFNPIAPGARMGAIRIYDNTTPTPVLEATVFLQGSGTGPQIIFLPGSQFVLANASTNGLASPYGTVVDAGGSVYIADPGNNQVLKETLSAGQYTQSVVANAANNGLSNPVGVALDGSGNVYIADQNNQRVLKETPAGTGFLQSVVADSTGNGLTAPSAVAVDRSGNIYIADSTANRVLKEAFTGGVYTQTVVADGTTNGLSSPTGIAVDVSGNVYIADSNNVRVLKETLSGGTYSQSIVANSSNGLQTPVGVAVDGVGDVYIADTSKGILREVFSAGTWKQRVLVTPSGNGLKSPRGVAVNARGNVYISDTGSARVLKEDFADAPRVNFATTAVGSTSPDSPRTVTLMNVGNATLTFPVPASGNNPSISANFQLNSSVASACPLLTSSSTSAATLAGGASCLLSISFVPTTTGALTGSLVVTDNALNVTGATQSISLSGTGVAASTTSPAPSPNGTMEPSGTGAEPSSMR